jgi:hypothetical protein
MQTNFVSSEFMGLARHYIQRTTNLAALRDAAIYARFAEIDKRLAGGHVVRRESFFEILRMLRLLSAENRFALHHLKVGAHGLTILEAYLGGSRGAYEKWGGVVAPNKMNAYNSELTVDVMVSRIALSPRQCGYEDECVASVGHHALARRFQKGFDNSADAIKEDLGRLLLNAEDLRSKSKFYLECRSGGAWVGNTVLAGANRADARMSIDVRTFFSTEEQRQDVPLQRAS